MEKYKVIEILQTFSREELIDFARFVSSPFFCRKAEPAQLLQAITKNWPEIPEFKERLFAELFPNRPYDDKTLRYLTSQLNQLAEQFLAVRTFLNQDLQRDVTLMETMIERRLEKSYRQQQRATINKLQSSPTHDSEFFFYQLKISELEERHFQLQRQRSFDPSLQKASEWLDRFYFLQKLKFSCGMLDRQHIIKGDYQLSLSDDLVRYVVQNDFFGEQHIFYYYNVLLALRDETNTLHFEHLRTLLLTPSPEIATADLRDLYYFAINYCLRKIRQGKDHFLQKALDLYQAGINRKILLDEGILSPWTFTNVVKLALRLEKYQWIDSFIEQYVYLLPEQFQSDALHYNLAERYYYTRDFDQAIHHLNQVKGSDINYLLGSRVLLAKTYYEEGEEEALLSLIAAFSMFLKRNKKLSNPIKKTYLNFCNLLFRILKRQPGRWEQIEKRMRETDLLTDRKWLEGILTKERAIHP